MSAGRPVLIVQTAGARLAFDARDVRGIRGIPQTTPLPRSSAPLLGVFHHEGKVLPLFDLIAFAGGDTGTHRPRVVIVQAEEHELGVLVEEVLEVLPLPRVALGPHDPALAPALARIVQGRLRTGPAPEEEEHDPVTQAPGQETPGPAGKPVEEDLELRRRLEEILEDAPEWLRRIHLQDGRMREQAMLERSQNTLSSDPPVHQVDLGRLVDALSRGIVAVKGGVPA